LHELYEMAYSWVEITISVAQHGQNMTFINQLEKQ